jgi:hypothetical protein
MTAQRRRWLLVLCVVLTALLVWFAPQDEEPVSRPKVTVGADRSAGVQSGFTAERLAVAKVASVPMRADQLLRPGRTAIADVPDLFKPTSWYVPPPAPPPPPPVPPPPPPVPTAPALPYVYLGQIIEDQQVQVILSRGNRVVTALVGEVIEKIYRLESATGSLLTFVYLPLDIRQTLATGLAP